jgi:Trk K+ transport system NAD-binding subunit
MRKAASRWLRVYIKRPLLAFFRLPGSRGFGVLLFVFAVILVVAVIDLDLNYVNPENGKELDFIGAMYAVFALLVFETPLPLPESWLTRLVFFAVPIAGILVLGQGLLRLGSSFFDKNLWNKAMASTYTNHTIVCGLGKVSLRVIRWILDLDEEAIVIEQNRDNPFIEQARRWGVPVIIADARRPEVLLNDANIKQAEAIVPCTNDDLTNLSIALQARKLAPGLKVVLRMLAVEMAENVREGFDIHTVFSIPEISAPAFAAAATRAPLDHAFAIGEGKERGILTITTFTLVPESVLVGYTIGTLEDEFEVAIIALHREGKFMLHPHDDEGLSAGDRFVASASIEALNRLARLTPPSREMTRYKQGRWKIKSPK